MTEQSTIPGFESLYEDSISGKQPQKKALPPRFILPENIEKTIAFLSAYSIIGDCGSALRAAAILTHQKIRKDEGNTSLAIADDDESDPEPCVDRLRR